MIKNPTTTSLATSATPPARKTNTAIAIIGVALGALLTAAPDARAQYRNMFGAKLMTIPGSRSTLVSYTSTPTDSSGTNGLIKGDILIGDPTLGGAFTNAQWVTPLLGPISMIDTNTTLSTTVRYGMRNGTNGAEIVYIAVNTAYAWEVGPGTVLHTNYLSVFLPSQDADGDGLPDPGQVPVACRVFPTVSKVIGIVAPCTPPPAGPALDISQQPDHSLAIGWPASVTGFTLKSTPSLPSTNWVAVPGVQSNRAVIQPTDPQQFYRLQKQ